MRSTPRRVLLAIVGSAIGLAVATLAIACGHSYAAADADGPDGSDAFSEMASALDASDAAEASADATMSRYADLVMTDKPVGYWRLGEPAGAAFARDVLGKHDGVYSASNALAFGVAGALANDPDTAMTFDGNGRIVFGDAFDFGNDSAFSLELWLKTPLTNDSSYRRVISKESATEGYNLEVTPDGKLAFSVFAKGGPNVDGGIFDGVFVPVVAGTYVHVVAIYDTTAIQLYVNGALVETDPGVVTMPNRVDPFVIGGASFMTPLTDTRGTIDEVAVYDKILSPARILAHYLAGR